MSIKLLHRKLFLKMSFQGCRNINIFHVKIIQQIFQEPFALIIFEIILIRK